MAYIFLSIPAYQLFEKTVFCLFTFKEEHTEAYKTHE